MKSYTKVSVCIIIALVCLTQIPFPAFADIKEADCPLIGLKPLGQYLKATRARCFPSSTKAEAKGFFGFNVNSTQRPSNNSDTSCRFVGLKDQATYFSRKQVRCFQSVRQAKRLGFTKFNVITNIPDSSSSSSSNTSSSSSSSISSDFSSVSATGSSISSGSSSSSSPTLEQPITYNFILGPVQADYQGVCTAELSADRVVLVVECIHNVANATEAHIHPVPDNSKFCVLSNPPMEMSMTCTLTPEEAEVVKAGNALLSIHLGMGGENQACAAFIRNS